MNLLVERKRMILFGVFIFVIGVIYGLMSTDIFYVTDFLRDFLT